MKEQYNEMGLKIYVGLLFVLQQLSVATMKGHFSGNWRLRQIHNILKLNCKLKFLKTVKFKKKLEK